MKPHPAAREALPIGRQKKLPTDGSSAAHAPDADSWGAIVILGAAAVALGYALQISNGTYHPKALAWLAVAGALCLSGVVTLRSGSFARFGQRPAFFLLLAGLVLQGWVWLVTSGAGSRLGKAAFATVMLAAALLCVGIWSRASWPKHAAVAVLLASHFLLGALLIGRMPDPPIDVHLFHKESLDALLRGINPYTISVRDIYDHSLFYGDGIVSGGRVQIGFPYPPLSLFLSLPGHLLGGDYRYSHLAAMTLAAVLMAYARPGLLGALAAGLFLFTPRVFYILQWGWTEPYIVLLLSATVFCACRAPKLLPYALGLLFAIKQYMLFAAPLVFLLTPAPFRWKDLLGLLSRAVLVAALVTLPLALFNVRAFLDDVVFVQFRQPFRADALSYLVWLAQARNTNPPMWLAFAALVPATALALRRSARTPAGFAAAAALVYLSFFAFNKQAFGNYYFFVVGALCAAVAVAAASHNFPEKPVGGP